MRCGEVSITLRIDWKVSASFWRVRECFWMLKRARKGLEKKFGRWVIFWKKWVEVFVVMDSICGER